MLVLALLGSLCLPNSVSMPLEPLPQAPQPILAPQEQLVWSLALRDVAWAEVPEETDLLALEQLTRFPTWWGHRPHWAVLEGGGEVYLYAPEGESDQEPAVRLVATAPAGSDAKGSLIYRGSSGSYGKLDFALPAGSADPSSLADLHSGREAHHSDMSRQALPGSAWFRHNSQPESNAGAGAIALNEGRNRGPNNGEVSETFELFSGGRAVAENLQLDRLFINRLAVDPDAEPEPDVRLDTIEGITIKAFDWSTLIDESLESDLDPLLSWIPSDQHVLLTPSFQAFVDLIDELELRASPLVEMMEASSSSSRSRQAIERQLVLSLTGMTRFLGPALIKSVAITGGDLYMRTGTDVTLLFDCRNVPAVIEHLRKQYDDAASADAALTRSSQNGVEGIESVFGDVSSFYASEDGVVIVSNSRASLARVLAARTGKNLAQLEETQFFRQRYARAQTQMGSKETAFLLLSDETIRRWCGPKSRIAASHRLRALAALYELHSTYARELAQGIDSVRSLTMKDKRLPDLGQVTLHPGGVHSSLYGSIGNLTPIVEMQLETVTALDARLYGNWRDGYARNWSGGFDPIAAQIAITDEAFEGDLSVMPLIDNNDYAEMRRWTGQARLGAEHGDPHDGTLFHFALAIDPESEEVLSLQGMLSGFAPDEVSRFLGWMTGSVSVFADEDEIWDVALESGDIDEAMESLFVELNDLPVVVTVGSSSPLKLASWMAALRGFAEGASPGLTSWQTIEDDAGNAYVRVGAEDMTSNDEHLLYATLPEALVLGLESESLLRTMNRYGAKRAEQGNTAAASSPWLGESAGLRISSKGIAIFGSLFGDSIGEETQRHTFANLPILNEWKRLFPDQNPVEVHRRILGEELRCGAGGEFVWDDEWKTMASTVFGHPAAPKPVPHLPPAIGDIKQLDAGLTFELDGLRARLRAQR